jgi:hypothetical protein
MYAAGVDVQNVQFKSHTCSLQQHDQVRLSDSAVPDVPIIMSSSSFSAINGLVRGLVHVSLINSEHGIGSA